MIYHFNSIFTGKNIGAYYNQCCGIVPAGEWICLWDADVMTFHTFTGWNEFLEKVISENKDTGLFSCVANRIGTHKQRVNKEQCTNPSMAYHRELSEARLKQYGTRVRKDVKSVSGLMLLFPKKLWEAVGGFKEDGMLAVDTEFSRAIYEKGYCIGIMEGMYVMHYYRFTEGNHSHLI